MIKSKLDPDSYRDQAHRISYFHTVFRDHTGSRRKLLAAGSDGSRRKLLAAGTFPLTSFYFEPPYHIQTAE